MCYFLVPQVVALIEDGVFPGRIFGEVDGAHGEVFVGGRGQEDGGAEKRERHVRGDLAGGGGAGPERHPAQERVRSLPHGVGLRVPAGRHGEESAAELRIQGGLVAGVGARGRGHVLEAQDQRRQVFARQWRPAALPQLHHPRRPHVGQQPASRPLGGRRRQKT